MSTSAISSHRPYPASREAEYEYPDEFLELLRAAGIAPPNVNNEDENMGDESSVRLFLHIDATI